jgi:hypothetical protein
MRSSTDLKINMSSIPLDKTLCKQCPKCQEFTYQRSLHHGKRKGELFKFKYCLGDLDIVKIGEWGPDTTTLKDGSKREYVCSTKRHEGRARHFEYFLKKNQDNVIFHLGETSDLRMKNLREISKRCEIQNRESKESIFPGVGLTSWYNANPNKSHDKKIWYARVKVNGKEDYLDNYYTELEAAHGYYGEMERLNLDINKQTEAYNIYQSWLHVRETVTPIVKQILNDYNSLENVDIKWYLDLIKNESEKKLRENHLKA